MSPMSDSRKTAPAPEEPVQPSSPQDTATPLDYREQFQVNVGHKNLAVCVIRPDRAVM